MSPSLETRRRPLRGLALNLLVILVFASAVQWLWGWGRLLTPWRTLPPGPVALALLGLLLSYGLRAARIYLAEPDLPRGRLGACLRLILINNAFNWMLPMRSGEASFPILMRRWFGVDLGRATGILLWLRLLDLHVLTAVGVVCAVRGWLGSGGEDFAYAFAAACVSAPLVVFALRRPLLQRLDARPRPGRILRILTQALHGLPRGFGGLLRDLAMSWSAWAVKLAALGWLLGRLSGLRPALGVLGAIGGDASTVLPIHAPGGFGTYEAGVLALLAPAQAPGPALLAAAVNLHLFVLVTALLAGLTAWVIGPPMLDSAPKSKSQT